MRISYLTIGAVALIIAAGCTSAADIHTIQSPSAHFGSYRTFSFDLRETSPGGYAASPRSEDVRAHVRETTTLILRNRGYVEARSDPADLILRIEVGRREAAAPPTSPIGLQPTYPGYQMDYLPVVPPYHGYFDVENQELVEGAIVIDAFEGRTHELLWHGFARSVITRPDKVDYDHLRRTVESVLASFPASNAH
jgi:Domain of unknown function (DUF4136)